jgi:SnoaL-like domain
MKTRMLCAVAALAAGLLVSAGLTGLSAAEDREFPKKNLPYPDVTDTSHATDHVEDIMEGFFSAKSLHNGTKMMTYWAPDPVLYIDAAAGATWPSRAALTAIWTGPFFANAPPNALSYPLRIIGNSRSALVEFVDTPQLFGSELRILASITFNDKGQIVRWIDYWDGRSALGGFPIGPSYPTDFHDSVVNASPVIKNVAQALQTAFAVGDAATATALFTPDAVFEDMALHTRVEGQLQIGRYLTRGLGVLPYGIGATVAHVVGSDDGGGYEWHAALSAAPLKRGNTALELDEHGKISRFTVIYDSFQFPTAVYQSLVLLAAEK